MFLYMYDFVVAVVVVFFSFGICKEPLLNSLNDLHKNSLHYVCSMYVPKDLFSILDKHFLPLYGVVKPLPTLSKDKKHKTIAKFSE